MCIGDALRELAGFLDGCEDEGHVTGVGLVERHERGGSRELSADVELELSASGAEGRGLELRGASVDGDGRLGLDFQSLDPVVPAPVGRVEVEPTGATFGSDGTLTLTLTATVPADGEVGTDGSATDQPTTDGGPTVGDRGEPEDDGEAAAEPRDGPHGKRDVPPFRDPELLAEVYESCDTFAEMTDAIGMDVTAETVRRYMIDYGIHQPNSYDTGGDTGDVEEGGDERERVEDDAEGIDAPREVEGSAEEVDDGSPVVLADGIGLPDEVTVETLIETVRASNTLYEVERDIGVDREDALDMLRDLNLLDLVVGRLATKDRRDIDREDVVERLREASATAAGTPG